MHKYLKLMKRLLLLMLLCLGAKAYAQNPDSLTFAVLGNSISTYYDYLPSGYAIYYSQDYLAIPYCLLKAKTIVYSGEPLYIYRYTPQSTMRGLFERTCSV